MATDKKQVEIPGRLHSVATEGVVAGANEILDDNKGKNQQEINASVDDSLQENKTNIANEITRATNAENAIKGGSSKSIQNLDSRLSTVEAHDTISMDGGSVVVGTAEDFTNRTTAGDAKIPTVGAILNAADEEPTMGSNNLVKSGGVDDVTRPVPDLVEVVGLTEKSRNIFPQAVHSHLFKSGNTFVNGTTLQSYILKVKPNSIVTVDQKTTGDRFTIYSSSDYPAAGVTVIQTISGNTAQKLNITLGASEKYIVIYVNSNGDVDVSNLRVYYGTEFILTPSTTLASKEELHQFETKVSLFDGTEINDYVSKFFKNIKVYGVSVDKRLLIRLVWKNTSSNFYGIWIYTTDGTQELYVHPTTPDTHISKDLENGGHVEIDVDWNEIPEGSWETATENNIISLRCYERYLVNQLTTAVAQINEELNKGKSPVGMSDLTENGYYDANGVFQSNSNLKSAKITVPDKSVAFYYSASRYYPTFQRFCLFNGTKLIGTKEVNNTDYDGFSIPSDCTHISISILKTESFSGYFQLDAVKDDEEQTFIDTESSLRDALWAQDIKNPFAWKPFTKAYVTFMNDGCKDDVNSYRLACEKYGVPYITTFQIPRLSASITYIDVDGNARYFGRELITGQEYLLSIASEDSYSKLRIYCDCRCPLLGQQANVTIKYYTTSSVYTSSTETVILSAGKTYISLQNMSGVIKVGIIVSCGNALIVPFVNFCLTPYDSSINNTTKTGAEIGALIYQNFGEVMQHGDWLFNTLDQEKAYEEFIKQSYVYKKQMEEAIGVKIHGLIGLGGTNSGRWQHTDMGQKFMLRNYLYSNWFGTTPQYSIPRTGLIAMSSFVFTFTTSVSLTIGSTYLMDAGNNKTDSIVILDIDGTTITAAKRSNNNNYALPQSGNLYNTSNAPVGTFSNCSLADDEITGYWYVEQNKDKIAEAISNHSWHIIWCHSEMKPICYDAMCKYISELTGYGTDIEFATFGDMYNKYKSSELQER